MKHKPSAPARWTAIVADRDSLDIWTKLECADLEYLLEVAREYQTDGYAIFVGLS